MAVLIWPVAALIMLFLSLSPFLSSLSLSLSCFLFHYFFVSLLFFSLLISFFLCRSPSQSFSRALSLLPFVFYSTLFLLVPLFATRTVAIR